MKFSTQIFARKLGASAGGVLATLSLAVLAAGAGPQNQSGEAKGEALVQVEARYVCMINSTRFDKEQIPVKVAGRTYYGCCPMCADKLRYSPESREAIDPVSGKKVDKATAVLGASKAGKVYYFENVENLKKFRVEPDASDGGDQTKEKH